MIFLLDNLDSFTYNIAQVTSKLGFAVTVKRACETSREDIQSLAPQKIVLSPGPGRPKEHPFLFDLLHHFSGKIPILGICLGMQAINEHFGGTICRDAQPMHGKTSFILHDNSSLFTGLDQPFEAARYHSLIIDQLAFGFKKTAWTSEGTIMAFEHRKVPLYGVQFHPESFLTPQGDRLLENFYKTVPLCKGDFQGVDEACRSHP